MKAIYLNTEPGFSSLSLEEKTKICNGAGAANDWRSSLIPNTMYGLDCTQVFDIHDYAYHVGATRADKDRADMSMLINLMRVINKQGGVLAFPRRYRAMTYYEAVTEFGDDAFFVIKQKRENKMIDVALSIAHYEQAKGAGYAGRYEHGTSEEWTKCLAKHLLEKGLTTKTVAKGKLPLKVKEVNTLKAKAAIEIHFNAGGSLTTNGCETLYFPGSAKGKKLATCVQGLLVTAMGNRDRGVIEGWYRMDRPGVIDYKGDVDGDEKPDYFLRKTNCPALILEPDFVTQWGNIDDKMEMACWSIAQGISAFLGHN